MSAPRIAIIGAGPGGLTLARLLQKNGMSCTIFELDQDRSTRDQGGAVDLHAESGQLALREAGLFEEFEKSTIPGAEAMKLVKADGTVCWDENTTQASPDTSRNRPEIDRKKLRDLLLDSVEPDSIQWNRKVVRVEATNTLEKKYAIHFLDSVEMGFDLVVGADGAWSKVRLLLTDQLPYYSGVTLIEMIAADVSTKKEWLCNYAGQGNYFMFDEGRALICQRNGNDRIRVYAGVRQHKTWIKDCGIDWEQPDLARKQIAEQYYGDCHEDIKRVIASEATDGLTARPLYMLPVGFKWKPRAGITLLGDAAHLMTPFGGVGVNVALTDALELSRALLKRKDLFQADLAGNLAEALKEYEVVMLGRAKDNMEMTSEGLKGHFSAGGVEQRVKKLQWRAAKIAEMKHKMELEKEASKIGVN